MDKLKSWSLINFGRAKKKNVKRRGRRGEEEGEEEEKRRENVRNLLSFVWILVWKYGFSMEVWVFMD